MIAVLKRQLQTYDIAGNEMTCKEKKYTKGKQRSFVPPRPSPAKQSCEQQKRGQSGPW
jgi:hypothetical protein